MVAGASRQRSSLCCMATVYFHDQAASPFHDDWAPDSPLPCALSLSSSAGQAMYQAASRRGRFQKVKGVSATVVARGWDEFARPRAPPFRRPAAVCRAPLPRSGRTSRFSSSTLIRSMKKGAIGAPFPFTAGEASPSWRQLCDISAKIRLRERRPTINDWQRHHSHVIPHRLLGRKRPLVFAGQAA